MDPPHTAKFHARHHTRTAQPSEIRGRHARQSTGLRDGHHFCFWKLSHASQPATDLGGAQRTQNCIERTAAARDTDDSPTPIISAAVSWEIPIPSIDGIEFGGRFKFGFPTFMFAISAATIAHCDGERCRRCMDGQLIQWATEIRMRADATEIRLLARRELGLIMAKQKVAGLMATGTRGNIQEVISGGVPDTPPGDRPITLAEAGIDKNLAKRARNEASKSEEEHKEFVAKAKQRQLNAIEGNKVNRTSFTADNEWFTPPEYLALARTVLGEKFGKKIWPRRFSGSTHREPGDHQIEAQFCGWVACESGARNRGRPGPSLNAASGAMAGGGQAGPQVRFPEPDCKTNRKTSRQHP